ncbi:DUF4381 domain-containing protein [Lutimonas sp.]|uniref:DUF4381 domain-containing protein n=1 Tax=Lutimonas sp. TaxID=1872403 RepID=UPI003D9BC95A
MLVRLHIINFLKGHQDVQAQELAEEMKQLGPIMEADPVKFSFNTPGWYILGAFMLVSVLFFAVRQIKKYRANTYRREALKKLNQLKNGLNEANEHQQLSGVLAILKIVAIQTYGRQAVANLYGKEWLLFLDSKIKGNSFAPFEMTINNSIYKGAQATEVDLASFHIVSKNWIQKHA